MKKMIAALLVTAVAASALAGCGSSSSSSTASTASETTASVTAGGEADKEKGDGVMTYADFAAADVDTQVTVETYIQARQAWWEDNGQGEATFYTQDADGGYFIYNMPCTEDDYNDKLVPGTKIKVTGYKSEWSGEIEITDATYEIEDGNFIAEAQDVTGQLGTDELQNYMNQYVVFKDLTVAASTGADGSEVAYLYNYDGSGSEGDDLYFNVTDANGNTYTFTVESYLCDKDSAVYKAVEKLNVGDEIDAQGFLYWYNGPQPHIVSVATYSA